LLAGIHQLLVEGIPLRLRPSWLHVVEVEEALYERQAPILEAVAKRYDEKSPEYTAIKQASIALWYALSQPNDDFVAYLQNWESGELTPEQIAHLKSMGIDTDAID
jgi:hypothetical protein